MVTLRTCCPRASAVSMPVPVQLPLFVVSLVSIVAGMVLGYLWSDLREYKLSQARSPRGPRVRRTSTRGRAASASRAASQRTMSSRISEKPLTPARYGCQDLRAYRSRADAIAAASGRSELWRSGVLSKSAAASDPSRCPVDRRRDAREHDPGRADRRCRGSRSRRSWWRGAHRHSAIAWQRKPRRVAEVGRASACR